MSDLITWHAPYAGWLVLASWAAVGLLLVLLGLRRHVGKIDPSRCPRCRYDIRFSPNSICSECGHDRSQSPGLPFRRWWLAAIGVIVAVGLPIYVAQMRIREFGWHYYECVGPIYWLWPRVAVTQLHSGSTRVVLSEDRRAYLHRYYPTRIEVFTGSRRCFQTESEILELGWPKNPRNPDSIEIAPIQDLDNDSTPELIVHSMDYGNSGAEMLYIISLGEHPFCWDPADARSRGSMMRPESPDGQLASSFFRAADGSLRVAAEDFTFVFWKVCHAGSAYPPVVLKFEGGQMIPDLELMRKPLPSPIELEFQIAACQQAGWKSPDPDGMRYDDFYPPLVRTMLELIYTGHAAEAYAFLDRAWPGPEDAKAEFIAEFKQQLAGSPYAKALIALGHPPFAPIASDNAAAAKAD